MGKDENTNNTKPSLLGVPTEDIANLSVDDIVNNKSAVTMVFHYYKIMAEENIALKNERNTLQTYVSAFERKKSDSATAAVLLLISNVGISMGTNLLTSSNLIPGIATITPAIIFALAGLYFQFIKDRSAK
jgi:hypothetical protein